MSIIQYEKEDFFELFAMLKHNLSTIKNVIRISEAFRWNTISDEDDTDFLYFLELLLKELFFANRLANLYFHDESAENITITIPNYYKWRFEVHTDYYLSEFTIPVTYTKLRNILDNCTDRYGNSYLPGVFKDVTLAILKSMADEHFRAGFRHEHLT